METMETIGILGLGYVGLPLALRLSETRSRVIGFDIDDERIEILNSGRSPIKHLPGAKVAAMSQQASRRQPIFPVLRNVTRC